MGNAEDGSAVREVRALLHAAKFARLATIDARTGRPFISLLAVALSAAGQPLTLISSLARHTANLAADGNASLLYEEPVPGDDHLLARPRATVSGAMTKCDGDDERGRFLELHEDAHVYADFTDFALWRMEIGDAYLVAGFGRIHTIPGPALMA